METDKFKGAVSTQNSLLRIGDTVMLYYNAEQRSKEEADNNGYIISDLSVTNNHSLILFPSDLVNPDIPNIQFGTFKVLVENKYEAQARVDQEKKWLESTDKEMGMEGESSVQIAQAMKAVELELKENRAKQKRLNGAPIFYGENIQLQHTLTKKYLGACSMEVSRTEHTKLKVNLQEKDGKGCIFKILPRYKIQSVGEEVHYNDQVKFESLVTEGQFLHCSKLKFGDVKIKANKQCHELNLASTDSPLTIIRHYQPKMDHELKDREKELGGIALKGGGTVRLYHRKYEGYVVAEGSFAGVYASLNEIRRVHEMHPEFKAFEPKHQQLLSQTDTTLSTSSTPLRSAIKHQGNTKGKDKKAYKSIVLADMEPQIMNPEANPHPPTAPPPLVRQQSQTSLCDISELYFSSVSSRIEPDYNDIGERDENRGVVDEDVHFRRRKRDKSTKNSSRTSANTFWQIEKLSDSKSGEPIKWNEKCRIKHLPTRMYLAVVSEKYMDTKVKLVSSKTAAENNSAAFVLLPVIRQEGGIVHYESYCRIKHSMTDTWLHFNKDITYKHRNNMVSGNSAATELFQVGATKELNHDDAFILEQVEDESVTTFNYVAGITAVLTNQIKECRLVSSWTQGPHHMHQHCHALQTIATLRDLHDFLDEPSSIERAKQKRKLIRNLKVVELVVYLVEIHRDETSNDPEISSACFGVISKYLEGDSVKNKKSTTPMADYLFPGTIWRTELSDEHSIENMLLCLVKNSPSLLIGDNEFVCRVAKHLVDKLILKHDYPQAPQLLDTLSVLCVCNDIPIKRNQDKILKYLNETYREGSHIFYALCMSKNQTHQRNVPNGVNHQGTRLDHRRDPRHKDVSINMEEEWNPHVERASLVTAQYQGDVITSHGNRETDNYYSNSVQLVKNGIRQDLDGSMHSTTMRFLEAQLNLLVKLCLGDNVKVIEALTKEPVISEGSNSLGIQITFNQIMFALSVKMPPEIKTLYVKLLQAMFVDVGKNIPFLDQLPFLFKLKEVTVKPFADTVFTDPRDSDKGEITALTKVENIYFPTIKKWIEKFFRDMEPPAADQTGENNFLSQILILLSTLIKYGYYDDPEHVTQPLKKVLNILDGKNDYPTGAVRAYKKGEIRVQAQRRWHRVVYQDRSRVLDTDVTGSSRHSTSTDKQLQKEVKAQIHEFRTCSRFRNKPVNQSLFKIKKCAMEVLDLLFNYCFYRSLHLFVNDYKGITKSRKNKAVHLATELFRLVELDMNPSRWKQATYIPCFSKKKREDLNKHNSLACNHPRFVKAARIRLQTLLSENGLNMHGNKELPGIFLDLTNYEDNDLIQGSLQLLDKYYTTEEKLLSSAYQTQLLTTDESISLYNLIETVVLSSLRELLDVKNVMDSSRSLIHFSGGVGGGGGGSGSDGISALDMLTRKCWIQGEVIGSEPHQQNQKIVYNFGVTSSVLGFIQQQADKPTIAPTTLSSHFQRKKTARAIQRLMEVENKTKAILIQCFKFLRALACGQKEIQTRLLPNVDSFLKTAVGDVAPHVARLLTEIFSSGPALSLKVSEHQISCMMELIFKKGSKKSAGSVSMEAKAEFTNVLEELVMVKSLSLPVKHNQNIFMKKFSHIRDDGHYWCKELLREGRREYRLNMLRTEHDTTEELQLFLILTDLLASCAMGENTTTESICCTVYTIDEVLSIIIDPNIKLYRKRPFIRFLTWVYMNVEQSQKAKKALSLVDNKKLWKCLDNSATMLTKVGLHMKKITNDQYQRCKECIWAPLWKYGHYLYHKDNVHTGLPSVTGINGPTSEDNILLPDALLYLAEGLMPFMEIFYTSCFDLTSCSQSDPKKNISENLCAALLRFSSPFNSTRVYFSMEVQVKLYRRVIYIFRHHFTNRKQKIKDVFPYVCLYEFEEIERVCGGNMCDVITTDARKEYNRYYKEETELNERFHRFVFRYKLSYQGPNNVRAQIGARVKRSNQRRYSQFVDEEMMIPGHEYLPLGPSFQEHVACFTKNSNSIGSLYSRVSCERIVDTNFVERLLKQLEISHKNGCTSLNEMSQRRQVELDIKCLQILRCIIYNYIMLIDPELKERNPNKYRILCSTKIHPVQKAIQDLGNTISRVMPLLLHPDDRVIIEVLAFLNVLLESGNVYIQLGLKELMNSKEHPMLPTLKRMLRQASIAYSESLYLSRKMKLRINRDKLLGLMWKSNTTGPTKKNVASRQRVVHPSSSVFSIEDMQFQGREHAGVTISPRNHRPIQAPHNIRSPFFARRRSSNALLRKKKKENNPTEKKRLPFMEVYQHASLIPGLDEVTIEVINFHDLSHIELTMKVLGRMCDGQYRDMQHFLREQREKIHSINIVDEIMSFLQVFYQSRNIDSKTINLFHHMLQTLIEMSVGNYANQLVIFNQQIIPILNNILQIDITGIKPLPKNSARRPQNEIAPLEDIVIESSEYQKLRKQALELKGSAVELLDCMLEETSSKTKELAIQLYNGLDVDALHQTMVDFHMLRVDKDIIRDEYDDNAERALYRTYHILIRLNYYGVKMKDIEPEKELECYKIWEECKNSSKSVEIVYKNDEGEEILTKVHFKYDPKNPFREELTDRVKLQINRHSPEDKLRDFLEWMDVVKKDTVHHRRLRQNKYTLRPVISFGFERYYLLLFMTLLMNILVLVNFDLPDSSSQNNSNETVLFIGPSTPDVTYEWFSTYVLYILGGIHLFLSLWMVAEYFVINLPNFVPPRIIHKIMNKLFSVIRKWLKSSSSKSSSSKYWSNSRSARLYKLFKVPRRTYGDVNIFGVKSIYVVLFLASSALSLKYYGYFYCICLLYIVVNNDILQKTLQSITKNAKALLWVGAFILTILFIYAVVSFAFLYRSFIHDDNDDLDNDNLFCESLVQCFVTIIRWGLIEDLGVVVPIVPLDYKVAGVRLLFDVSFFIIVTIIGLNIVFGIIVDTFSELRNEKYQAEQDMKSVCFICGLHSHKFQRILDHGFKKHVKQEHNMWAYIYYSVYLDQIDTSDHNAIEKYIHKKMKSGNIDYFPINRALVLTHTLSENEKTNNELRTMMKAVLDRFGSLQELLNATSSQDEDL